MDSPETLIKIKNLWVEYPGSVLALADVNLDIASGSIVGLVGPNGAGKTTLMKCIAGILEPDRGQIEIAGRRVERPSGVNALEIGYVPDNSPLYEGISVREYLEHFANAFRISDTSTVIAESLGRTRLDGKADELCRGLSRGMKQRLMLAKAILHRPKLYLMDEPASGLDPYGRKELYQIIQELAEDGATVIISSHILAELAQASSHILVLEKGRIQNFSNLSSGEADEREHWIVVLRWSLDDFELSAAMSGFSGVEVAQQKNKAEIRIPRKGDQSLAQQLDPILAHLAHQGLGLLEWRVQDFDLESVYFRQNAKELS